MTDAPIDLSDLGPLYHDYAFFGASGEQLPGIYGPNQRAKAPMITAYTALAIADVLEGGDDVSFVELFCADAYYAMVAARLGATSVRGVDNHRDEFSDKAPEIARRLGIEGFELIDADVADMASLEPADIVANVGGLYHVSNPEEVLQASYELAARYLIVQSVVSLANEDPDYFEAPAPGWDLGSRYNPISFDTMVRDQGWNLLAWHRNELTGNTDASSRGSVYYLIEK
jgi:hypothetical protein